MDVLSLASTAARRIQRRYAHLDLADIREDLAQEAALAIVAELRRDATRSTGWLVVAATNRVSDWLTRVWWNQPHTTPLDADAAAAVAGAVEEDVFDVHALVAHGRVRGGARAEAAIARDVAIIERRAAGWSESEIGGDLGLTKSNVHQALTRLRERHHQQGDRP